MSLKRVLLAFLLAPLLPAACNAVIVASEYHPLAIFVISGTGIYALQLVVDIPGYLLLHRSGRHGLQVYALFGLSVGAALVLAARLLSHPDDGVLGGLMACIYFGLLGAATTASFWSVARPDRTTQRATPSPS